MTNQPNHVSIAILLIHHLLLPLPLPLPSSSRLFPHLQNLSTTTTTTISHQEKRRRKKRRKKGNRSKHTLRRTSFSPSSTFPLFFSALTFRSITSFSFSFSTPGFGFGLGFRFSLRSVGAFRPRRRASSAASAWEAADCVLDRTGFGVRVGETARGIFGGSGGG